MQFVNFFTCLNKMGHLKYIFPLFFFNTLAFAQVKISGRIIDAQSGEPLPYVNIVFKNAQEGTITDFDGNYFLQSENNFDSIVVNFIGYVSITKSIETGISQMNIGLQPEAHGLTEFVIKPGANPALPIIKKAQKNKSLFISAV